MKTSMRNLLLNLAAIGLLALFLAWAEAHPDVYKVQTPHPVCYPPLTLPES